MIELSQKRPLCGTLVVLICFMATSACVDGGGPVGSMDTGLSGVDLTQQTGDQLDPSDKIGGDAQAIDTVPDAAMSDAQTIDVEGPPTDVGTEDAGDAGPQAGEFLYPCEENKDCYSGYCVEAPEGSLCSKTCFDSDSCPAGWSCSQLSGSGDTVFICVPNDTFLCRPCEEDADCNEPGLPKTGVCRSFGEYGSICSRTCSDDVACPSGFACNAVQPYGPDGPSVDLCDSEDGQACTCTRRFVDEQASTSCVVTNDLGTCSGSKTCTEVGPLPACDAVPATAEICNGIDDDCDGEIDESGAEGCTQYYKDTDGDGYGLGYGECFCEKPDIPGEVWLLQGGDCNELIASVHPGAVEMCNGFDDDCDGVVDETDAVGCIPHFADDDADGFGNSDVEACACSGNPFWSQVGGDCDDHDPGVSPAAIEICDKVDNDCNGSVDGEGASDCTPFFKDVDGDGFGLTDKVKCLCDPIADYTATLPNDCDESNAGINPTASEICNGEDDDCNGEVDEGALDSLCPFVPNGESLCLGADGCGLGACDEGWSDADGDVLNGCECGAGNLELPDMPGAMCNNPHFLATLVDTGEETSWTDNVVSNDPNGLPDEDWYSFTAIDGPDNGGCDSFHVKIKFEHNPGGQFVMDVNRGSCAGADNLCSGVSQYTEAVDFYDDGGPTVLGECPCVEGPSDDVTSPGVQRCSDQTATYYVRVYRKPGFETTCEAYTLRISNGL